MNQRELKQSIEEDPNLTDSEKARKLNALCEPYKDLDAILAEADLVIIGASNGLDMARGAYARRSTSCASLIQMPSPRPSSKSSRALCKSIAAVGLLSLNLAWDCATVS